MRPAAAAVSRQRQCHQCRAGPGETTQGSAPPAVMTRSRSLAWSLQVAAAATEGGGVEWSQAAGWAARGKRPSCHSSWGALPPSWGAERPAIKPSQRRQPHHARGRLGTTWLRRSRHCRKQVAGLPSSCPMSKTGGARRLAVRRGLMGGAGGSGTAAVAKEHGSMPTEAAAPLQHGHRHAGGRRRRRQATRRAKLVPEPRRAQHCNF